jgi:lactoylglutathione lyase
MQLAKSHIDVGLFTTNERDMLPFWQQEVGLSFEETLPLGGGVRQHRHEMNGSVLKLNAARDPVNVAPPAGYRELWIAREGVDEPRRLSDPDGNSVLLSPPSRGDVVGIGLQMRVADLHAHRRFWSGAMQFEEVDEGVFRCGDSLLWLTEDASVQRSEALRAPGYRYITVQVWDVDREHAGIVARGGTEGRPPVTLGSTARVSFVRDPDGNWIEISQRASLTGALAGQ